MKVSLRSIFGFPSSSLPTLNKPHKLFVDFKAGSKVSQIVRWNSEEFVCIVKVGQEVRTSEHPGGHNT